MSSEKLALADKLGALEERFADLDAHAQALGEYLVNRPDLYEVTATKSKGWLSKGTEYSVSFAELVIE